MSFEAKQNLVTDMKTKIGKMFTSDQTETVIVILQSVLTNFDVEECAEGLPERISLPGR